jgi:hypothetical protein
MAVAFDATTTSPTDSTTSGATCALTLGAIANGVVLVFIAWGTTGGGTCSPGTVSVKIGTTALAQIVSQAATNSSSRADIWGVATGSTTGAQTITVTWTGASIEAIFSAASFSGANQTGGATTFPHTNVGAASTANPSISVTSAVGDFTAALVVATNDIPGTPTQTAFTNYPFSGADFDNSCASRATGAASVTFGHTMSAVAWDAVAVDITVPGGAAHPLFRQSTMTGTGAGGPFFSNPLQAPRG